MSIEIDVISTLGFPIFVAVWMMVKSSKDNEKMREALDRLAMAVEGCPKRRH